MDQNNKTKRNLPSHKVSKRKDVKKLKGNTIGIEKQNKQTVASLVDKSTRIELKHCKLEIKQVRKTLKQTIDKLNTAEEIGEKKRIILEEVIACAGEPVFSIDSRYCYTSFNQQHANVMGELYGAEIEIGKNLLEYHTNPKDRVQARNNLDRAFKGETVLIESFAGEEGKSKRYFEIAHYPVKGSNGKVKGVTVYARDITELKTREEENLKITRTLKTLSNSNQAMMRATNETEFMEDVCLNIEKDCGYAMVWIGLAENDHDKSVRPVISAGFEDEYLENAKISWGDNQRGRGPTGTAIRTGKVSLCRNMLTDPKLLPWRPEAIKHGFASSIALPLSAAKTGYTLSAPIAYVNVLANQTLKNYVATPIIHNISGTVAVGGVTPLAGVTLTYTDGTIKTVTTDGSGNYTIPILDNWSGPVVPFLPGYSFTPILHLYPPVLADQPSQNFNATLLPNTISGNVGVGGALITYSGGTSGTTVADSAGNYIFPFLGSWSGTVTPTAAGYTFFPVNKSYTAQASSLVGENYIPTATTFTISGNAGIPLAVLSYTDGTSKSVTADGSGNYSLNVSYGWAGTVTPSLTGFAFNPANRVYTNVLASVTGQNYLVYPGAFNKISPANAATNQPTNPTLTWGASAMANSYQYCLSAALSTANCTAPASWKSTGTNTSVALTGLTPGTRYWQVRAINANGNTYANGGSLTTTTGWFSFTILAVPSAFSKSTPSNGAVNQPPSLVLSWASSTNATVYTYCISLVASCTAPAAWISTGANTNAIVSGLTPNTRYYWQVIGRNATGSVNANAGTWWSFTIIQRPGAFNKTSPANGAANQPTNPTLIWGTSARVASYSYCIDTVNNNACDASWISTGTNASVALTGLTPGTYYWEARATNVVGTTYANGSATSWWSFTILPLPGAFNKTSPANGSTNQPTNPTLRWGASTGAVSYQYCIDTINNGACDTSWISTGTGRTRALTGLIHGTTYYWAVRARNTTGVTSADAATSVWWSFLVP